VHQVGNQYIVRYEDLSYLIVQKNEIVFHVEENWIMLRIPFFWNMKFVCSKLWNWICSGATSRPRRKDFSPKPT